MKKLFFPALFLPLVLGLLGAGCASAPPGTNEEKPLSRVVPADEAPEAVVG